MACNGLSDAKRLDQHWVIGVNTGTSGDGVDVIAISFTETAMKVLGSHSLSFPTSISYPLQKVLNHSEFSWVDYAFLERQLAEITIVAIETLLEKLQLSIKDCQLIACHGQTIVYLREPAFTHQMMDPYRLVHHFSVPIIHDFRRWDLAHGGRGAPLSPLFHDYLCRVYHKSTFAFLNIGGISNVTVIEPGLLLGYDVGPGCCLLDEWFRRHHGRAMDDGGAWAEAGQVIEILLERWLSDPVLNSPPPRALAREYFTSSWLDQGLATYRPEDVHATLLALTSQAIIGALKKHQVKELCCFGGGSHIRALLKALAQHATLSKVESFGLSVQEMEPALFAWLGWMRINNRYHDNIQSVTGGAKTKLGLVCSP